jgi:hypothetical protein
MALVATSVLTVGIAPNLTAYIGTLTATAGDSGTIVIPSVNPLVTQYWTKTSAGDFTPLFVQQSYSSNTTTGRTTLTVTVDETVTDGKYYILAM